MLNWIGLKSGSLKGQPSGSSKMSGPNIIQTNYTSNAIDIPDTFLTGPPSKPVTSTPVAFASSKVPEYDGCTAFIVDNVLSLEECNELIALAEASAPTENPDDSPWKPALVSLGPGLEASAPDYRNSDRIIWDNQILVDRLWQRCKQAEGVEQLLAEIPGYNPLPGKWKFLRWNERMRFLKYTPGMFFKPHCDGPYYTKIGEREILTRYTVQLYLNDAGLVGGATSFLSRDKKRRLDVSPKAGSLLIFQHARLFHEGAEVKRGVKYTVRTDIMYEWEQDESKEEE